MIIFLKTEEEIEGFRKAGLFAGQVLKKVLDSVEVGVTTKYLDELARKECEVLQVKPVFLGHEGYPAVICASNNFTLVHGLPNDEKLKAGDVLSIDVGVEVDGFIGDTADTIIVGESFQETNKHNLLRACRLALQKAILEAKDGNKLSNISAQIYKTAKENNYSVPVEYGGHGINRYAMHADPFISNIPYENEDITLKYGMIIAIEPMFINGNNPKTSVGKDGWGVIVSDLSAHCEHTVLVGQKSGVVLTQR